MFPLFRLALFVVMDFLERDLKNGTVFYNSEEKDSVLGCSQLTPGGALFLGAVCVENCFPIRRRLVDFGGRMGDCLRYLAWAEELLCTVLFCLAKPQSCDRFNFLTLWYISHVFHSGLLSKTFFFPSPFSNVSVIISSSDFLPRIWS